MLILGLPVKEHNKMHNGGSFHWKKENNRIMIIIIHVL